MARQHTERGEELCPQRAAEPGMVAVTVAGGREEITCPPCPRQPPAPAPAPFVVGWPDPLAPLQQPSLAAFPLV